MNSAKKIFISIGTSNGVKKAIKTVVPLFQRHQRRNTGRSAEGKQQLHNLHYKLKFIYIALLMLVLVLTGIWGVRAVYGAVTKLEGGQQDAVVDADVDANAAIAGTKISPDFGSQNIVTMGSVGIATIGPTTELDVVGDITARGSGNVYGAKFWDYNDSSYWLDLNTTGEALNTAGIITVSGSGNNYFAGNVGIGTTSPSQKLTVNGDILISGNNYLRLGDTNHQIRTIAGYLEYNDAIAHVFNVEGQEVMGIYAGTVGIWDMEPDANLEVVGSLMVSNTAEGDGDWLVVTTSGKVGIGTTGPNQLLDVQANSIEVADNTINFADVADDYVLTFDIGTNTWAGEAAGGLWTPTGNDIYYDSGNVGIGTTSPRKGLEVLYNEAAGTIATFTRSVSAPDVALVANGSTQAGIKSEDDLVFFSDTSLDSYGTPDMIIQNGNVGIGTTSPQAKLHVWGGGVDVRDSNLNFSGTSGRNITNVDKLTVTTIDPVYEIDGEKYANYVSDYAGGVRVETSGILSTRSNLVGTASYVIDFNELEVGSDLWLFWQTIYQNLDSIVVLLTPNFNGRAWYEKIDSSKLAIYTDRAGEVSYRLNAPREDYTDWPNLISKE